jgi:hypothetical protein
LNTPPIFGYIIAQTKIYKGPIISYTSGGLLPTV